MATPELLKATLANRATVLDGFKAHSSNTRSDTKAVMLSMLRDEYQDYHVTEVDARQVSLFEFAAMGKAKLVLDSENETFHASRSWSSVGEGVEKKMHPGKLSDRYCFARFQYSWDGKEFLVYYITWQNPFERSAKWFYVLHPRAKSEIEDGHCAATDALIMTVGKWSSQLHEEIYVYDNGYWNKSKELWQAIKDSSWDDVILDPEMKKGLIEDIQGFFENQSLYAQFAMPWKRGVILHGVPGNGKTVSIKALMNALYSRPDPIVSLYVKTFATNCNTDQYAVQEIFQMARSMSPCLLIFEDLDSLVKDEVRSYFLNEVDGLESNDGILMIGSTNHLDKLDPAIAKRPSRFDRKYHYKVPGEEERRLYAEYWRKKLLKNSTVEFPEELSGVIAQLSEGFSFAYLKEMFVMTLLSLARGCKDLEVETEAGAKADGETESSTDEEVTKTPDESEEVCECKTKCATCNKPLPSAEKKDNKSSESVDEAASKGKLTMPKVDVPEHLQDNLLLKIVKYNIHVLHTEMDNTEDNDNKG